MQSAVPRATVSDWGSAFALLDRALSGSRKTVVLLDEISWMGRHDPVVRGNAWFDALVPFEKLLGRDGS